MGEYKDFGSEGVLLQLLTAPEPEFLSVHVLILNVRNLPLTIEWQFSFKLQET